MRHEISVLLHNIPCYTKRQINKKLLAADCNVEGSFDIFMFSDYIKIDFTRYEHSQDMALIDILYDLDYTGLRPLLRTIELEVYK